MSTSKAPRRGLSTTSPNSSSPFPDLTLVTTEPASGTSSRKSSVVSTSSDKSDQSSLWPLSPTSSIPTSPRDERRYSMNQGIKSRLTDLLNCTAVRRDNKMRLFVQAQLMDTEQELKRERKRRVSASSVVEVSPTDTAAGVVTEAEDPRRTSGEQR